MVLAKKIFRAAVPAALFFLLLAIVPATAAERPLPRPSATAVAAAVPQITGVRYGKKDGRERLVIELTAETPYTAVWEKNNTRLIIRLPAVRKRRGKTPLIRSDVIKAVTYRRDKDGFIVTVDLYKPMTGQIAVLRNPWRLVVDIPAAVKITDGLESYKKTIAPGLVLTNFVERNADDGWRAYMLTVDPKRYRLKPVLARGKVPGRDTVAQMVADAGALAGINAGYFDGDGTILGLLRIDGVICGTTYIRRSALGLYKTGGAFIAPIEYKGSVTMKNKSLWVAGVNAPRETDAVVIYNSFFGARTGTNEYGREYIIKNGRVAAIGGFNSLIPADGVVVSVHGAAKAAFAGVRMGDKAEVIEDLGARWAAVPDIVGAGPQLVKRGRVAVTKNEEQFPADIARGRAPRTAVAIKSDGTFLLLVVDGRQDDARGSTLEELAEFLVRQGAASAINLDGGGSSEMVAENRVVNIPSDGWERPVGSALVVVRK